MAQKRMFSLTILNSAKFLKLPAETQMLYMHLCMRADDDGVVEAFTVMRLLGCSEDSLKILAAKEFIKVLNEDLVTYILDWKEHNAIRADRKINSIYKDLLVQVLPAIKVLEPKTRSDLKTKDKDLEEEDIVIIQYENLDGPVSVHEKNLDGPRTVQHENLDGIDQYRLDQYRLDQYRVVAVEEQKKDFENKKSAAGAMNPYRFFEENGFGMMTEYYKTFIDGYVEDGLSEDLIIRAMQEALDKGVRTWGYVKSILNRCISSNITTVEQFEAEQLKRINNTTVIASGRKKSATEIAMEELEAEWAAEEAAMAGGVNYS